MLREYGYTPNKKYHALPRSLTEGYICVLLRVWVRRSTPRLISEIRSAWISFPVMSLLSVDLEHSHGSMTICGLGSVIRWAFKNVLYPVSVLVLTSYWTWVPLWSPQHGLLFYQSLLDLNVYSPLESCIDRDDSQDFGQGWGLNLKNVSSDICFVC